jgi:hypothetical protein
MALQESWYCSTNPCKVGLETMIFPDFDKSNPCKRGRYLWGKIIRLGSLITVEITRSTWSQWKTGDIITIDKFHLWPAKSVEIPSPQLALFED